MCLDELVPLEDHQQEVVVLDVLESSPCVYIHLFVFEIKTKRETAALRMFEILQAMLVREDRLF
jgi:hypothetical protein